ncbi:MAG: hypothetical protein WCQ95_04320 [Bacteroidota bacterium]
MYPIFQYLIGSHAETLVSVSTRNYLTDKNLLNNFYSETTRINPRFSVVGLFVAYELTQPTQVTQPATSETQQATLETLETKLQNLLTEIYNDIPATVWTDTDRTTLHRKTGLAKTKTVVTKPITESCFVSVKILTGGKVQLTCSTNNDKTLASKAEKADGVMIAQRIVPPLDSSISGGNDLAGKVKHLALMSADDGTEKVFYSKTTFIVDAGTANTGNYLLFYLRWHNSKHPELAGPWTGPYEQVIP